MTVDAVTGLVGVMVYGLAAFAFGWPIFLFFSTTVFNKLKSLELGLILSVVATLLLLAILYCVAMGSPASDEPSWYDYHPLV